MRKIIVIKNKTITKIIATVQEIENLATVLVYLEIILIAQI